MHKYYYLNGDLGGFPQKDKIWRHGSLRQQDIQSVLPNFPVKPRLERRPTMVRRFPAST